MISLLDLEKNDKKSIIYKALSEKKEWKQKQLNGHVKPQQQKRRIKIHSQTQAKIHKHPTHQYTQIHTHFDASYEKCRIWYNFKNMESKQI